MATYETPSPMPFLDLVRELLKPGNRLRRFVLGVFRRRGIPSQDLDDALHYLVVKLLSFGNSVEEPKELITWLGRVAHNHAINFLKKESRRKAKSLPSPDVAAKGHLLDELANAEFHALVHKEVMEVAESEPVIVLALIEGRKHTEIAKLLEIPRQTVEYRLARGIGKLRTALLRYK